MTSLSRGPRAKTNFGSLIRGISCGWRILRHPRYGRCRGPAARDCLRANFAPCSFRRSRAVSGAAGLGGPHGPALVGAPPARGRSFFRQLFDSSQLPLDRSRSVSKREKKAKAQPGAGESDHVYRRRWNAAGRSHILAGGSRSDEIPAR